MPKILVFSSDTNASGGGRLLDPRECGEIYNALAERVSALEDSLLPELPERVREALTRSLADCKRLVEVFE